MNYDDWKANEPTRELVQPDCLQCMDTGWVGTSWKLSQPTVCPCQLSDNDTAIGNRIIEQCGCIRVFERIGFEKYVHVCQAHCEEIGTDNNGQEVPDNKPIWERP